MTIHTPDHWIIIKIEEENETLYKVLGGWSGSYLHGSSWRLNSGITKVVKKDNHYDIYGASGSVYHCHKDMEELSISNGNIYSQLKEQYGDKINKVPINEVIL